MKRVAPIYPYQCPGQVLGVWFRQGCCSTASQPQGVAIASKPAQTLAGAAFKRVAV